MPFTQYRIRRNLYRDSVALMRLSSEMLGRPGVVDAFAMMATPANCAAAGLTAQALGDSAPSPDDLLLMVTARGDAEADSALDYAESSLSPAPAPSAYAAPAPHTLTQSLRLVPSANLALISVPGDYAYGQALQALKAGLDVMLFSSGVTLQDEACLKQEADRRGRLMMGAECGTAILNGTPLGFANRVRRGHIGIVAASGSGLQEVTCLIHNSGGGLSQAIGTGGRDLSPEVGGTTMLAGLALLQGDPETRVIVLLSKPPDPAVAARVLKAARQSDKPTIVAFLGADPGPVQGAGLMFAATLEDAAALAIRACCGIPPRQVFGKTVYKPPARNGGPGNRRYIRGLFAGGTLCYEAELILQQMCGPLVRPSPGDPLPQAHTCLDLGDETFTRGKPHPMIDARLRAELLAQAAADPATAVILFDVILGYGASADPVTPLLEAISAAPAGPVFVSHVCGTAEDPQGLDRQVARLREAGVIVAPTNATAARTAAEMVAA